MASQQSCFWLLIRNNTYIQGAVCVQVHIPLREGNDESNLSELAIDLLIESIA